MIEFRDTLTGLIDEFGQVEEDPFELPKPAVIGDKKTKQVSDSPTVSEPIILPRSLKSLIALSKTIIIDGIIIRWTTLRKTSCLTIVIQFFLDAGQNQRGIFLRVTEQTRFYRQAITSKLTYFDSMNFYGYLFV